MFKERHTEELNKGLRKVNLLSVVKGYLVEERYGAHNLIQSLIDGNLSLIHDKKPQKKNYLKKRGGGREGGRGGGGDKGWVKGGCLDGRGKI